MTMRRSFTGEEVRLMALLDGSVDVDILRKGKEICGSPFPGSTRGWYVCDLDPRHHGKHESADGCRWKAVP